MPPLTPGINARPRTGTQGSEFRPLPQFVNVPSKETWGQKANNIWNSDLLDLRSFPALSSVSCGPSVGTEQGTGGDWTWGSEKGGPSTSPLSSLSSDFSHYVLYVRGGHRGFSVAALSLAQCPARSGSLTVG